jgi:hypothetical protein
MYDGRLGHYIVAKRLVRGITKKTFSNHRKSREHALKITINSITPKITFFSDIEIGNKCAFDIEQQDIYLVQIGKGLHCL